METREDSLTASFLFIQNKENSMKSKERLYIAYGSNLNVRQMG